MKVYKSKFGTVDDKSLILHQQHHEAIALNQIAEIKISEQKLNFTGFLSLFKRRKYDFTIVLDNQKQIGFSFSQKSLNTALAFKSRILHMKFSL